MAEGWGCVRPRMVRGFASTTSTASTSGTNWFELVEAKAFSVEAIASVVEATRFNCEAISTW